MLKRAHHQQIVQILAQLRPELLESSQIAFGGGTAISLLNEEYRLSTDIDFMCCSPAGYRCVREIFFTKASKKQFLGGVTEVREFASGSNAVRGVVKIADGTPVKVEFVFEARITFEPFATRLSNIAALKHLPVLSTIDLFAEKLMATIDRGIDTAFSSRDLIDLCVMLQAYKMLPTESVDKFCSAYGLSPGLLAKLEKSKDLLRDTTYLDLCLKAMHIDQSYASVISDNLDKVSFPVDERTRKLRPQG